MVPNNLHLQLTSTDDWQTAHNFSSNGKKSDLTVLKNLQLKPRTYLDLTLENNTQLNELIMADHGGGFSQ
jgi:uncharacterized protein YxeA